MALLGTGCSRSEKKEPSLEAEVRKLADARPCEIVRKNEVLDNLNLPPEWPRREFTYGLYAGFPQFNPEPTAIQYCLLYHPDSDTSAYIGVVPGLGRATLEKWKREAKEREVPIRPVKNLGTEAYVTSVGDGGTGLLVLSENKLLAVKVQAGGPSGLERAKRIARKGLERL